MRKRDRNGRVGRVMSEAVYPLAFGVVVLTFLTAIERPGWFRIRPISGTAAAMWRSVADGAGQAPARPAPQAR